jgi:osmotically-inducible protein OsmY
MMKRMLWALVFTSSLCLAVGCSKEGTTSSSTTSTTDESSKAGLSNSSTSPSTANSTSTSTTTDADNTARNADNSTLAQTATGQSENKADIDITAAIRKAVVDDKNLSSNAHNVKIMTSGGVVTLRGPVKSEDEKRNIEAKAKQVAGVTRVDNLLEVEKNP